MSNLVGLSPMSSFIASFFNESHPIFFFSTSITLIWFVIFLPSCWLINFLDRKIGADIQARIGPNRSSPFGLLQFLADTLKLLQKNIKGGAGSGCRYFISPVLGMFFIFCGFCLLPITKDWFFVNTETSLLLSVSFFILYQVTIAWACYSFADAHSLISSYRYLINIAVFCAPLLVSIMPPIVLSGSVSLSEILEKQRGMPRHWYAFNNPGAFLSFIIFLITGLIWQVRPPFDAASSVAELSLGYRKNYSGVLLGINSLNEVGAFLIITSLSVVLFLGGGSVPFSLEILGRSANFVECLFFILKVFVLIVVFIWIRWTVPRVRLDQLSQMSWSYLFPLALLGGIITMVWNTVFSGGS